MPTDALVADLPCINLSASDAADLCNGKVVDLSATDVAPQTGTVATPADSQLCRVYAGDAAGRFIGLGRRSADGHLRVERLLATQ